MLKVARVGEKVSGKIVDITVKNNKNHILAPTWDIVMGLKEGRISWKDYEIAYLKLLKDRLETRSREFFEILNMAKTEDIYLVCFCKDERFCHRRLALEFLKRLDS